MSRDEMLALVMVAVGAVFLLGHIARYLGWPVPGFLFYRLDRMRRAWGERAGMWVHVISYIVVPFVLAWLLYTGRV
jgi:hypothetical protein